MPPVSAGGGLPPLSWSAVEKRIKEYATGTKQPVGKYALKMVSTGLSN
jgi:hypothetical protein